MFPKRNISMTPQPAADGPRPSAAFFLCPIACLPPVPPSARLEQLALLERAYQQAREVMRPSILERDLLAVWN